MEATQIHLKNYRQLIDEKEYMRDKITSKVSELVYVPISTLENALWDTNPRIHYSIGGEVIKFDTKGLSRVAEYLHTVDVIMKE